jgi:ribosomal protein S18 acetylase RimI-like enzyme
LSVGSAGIFVDAKNADAVRFYKRYGFIACHEQPYKLEADFRMFPGLTMENWVDN